MIGIAVILLALIFLCLIGPDGRAALVSGVLGLSAVAAVLAALGFGVLVIAATVF